KSLDDAVWAINPRNDSLPQLINYLGESAVEFLRTAGIRCHVDLPEHPPDWVMAAETRHHLSLVVKEALNNIARHAHATEATFSIRMTDETLTIALEDNGCGFEEMPNDGQADGLRNMRQRMAEMAGTFEIKSRPGEGTRVSFMTPWPLGARGRTSVAAVDSGINRCNGRNPLSNV